MGAISRGWALTKQSGAVLRNDQSLLVFPALSTIFAIMALVAIWLPTAVLTGVFPTEIVDESNPYYVVAMIVTAYVSTFIAIFFNVALATCAVRSLRGEDTTVGQGLSAAMQRIGPIVGWSLVAATVGLILRFLEDRLPLAGKIAVWIAGAAWAVATFFVVPVVALEGAGPWRSLKRSVEVVKARWGESATGTIAISAVTGLIIVAIIVIGGGGAFALFAAGMTPIAFAVAAVFVAAVIVVAIISSALSEIFRVAVYQYAVTGVAPAAFDSHLVQSAFDGRTPRA
jgi:hypothetical protein